MGPRQVPDAAVPAADVSRWVLQDGRTQACSSHKFENALAQAFSRVDEEFGKGEAAALVGTTVVVALVGSRHLYIANCGEALALGPSCPCGPALAHCAAAPCCVCKCAAHECGGLLAWAGTCKTSCGSAP